MQRREPLLTLRRRRIQATLPRLFITSSFVERCRRPFGNSSKMGCFSCFPWLRSKKKRNKMEKKERKLCAKKTPNASPRGDEIPNLKTAAGGVAFELELKPAIRTVPPIRHKFVESLLQSAEQRALQANIRRAEEHVRRGEAAKESKRKREIFLEQKAEQERQFVERAKSSLAIKELPNDAKIQANMAALKKRCKTARTRQKIMAVVTGRGGGTSPSASVN